MTQELVPPLPRANLALLDLGFVLGQTYALDVVGAAALGLKRPREERLYKHWCPDMSRFCRDHLKISTAEADHATRLLDEFGPDYFDFSALTRISPETFRAIAPAVKDGALHFNGEAIPLKPENTRKSRRPWLRCAGRSSFSAATCASTNGSSNWISAARRSSRSSRKSRAMRRSSGAPTLQLGAL